MIDLSNAAPVSVHSICTKVGNKSRQRRRQMPTVLAEKSNSWPIVLLFAPSAHCGLAKDVASNDSQDFRYWYRFDVDDFTVWARNRHHAQSLMSHLSGDDGDRNETGFYDLPKEFLKTRNRQNILRGLQELLARV